MDPFPEEWELLAFFESEPVILDPGIPWRYNELRFETRRGGDTFHCVIVGDYGRIKFQWWYRDELRVDLNLNWVRGMTIANGGGRDAMTLSFRDAYLLDLELQLRPHVCIQWGTDTTLP